MSKDKLTGIIPLDVLMDKIKELYTENYRLVVNPKQTTLSTKSYNIKLFDSNGSVHRRGTTYTVKEMKAFLKGMIYAKGGKI